MSLGHPVFYRGGQDPHWETLPQHLRDEVDEHIAALTEIDLGTPCIWLDLDTRQCRHYEHRPQMCRDFEMGRYHCRRMRVDQGIEL